jgi:flagellar basal body P-ring formation protein FlgA
MRRFILLIGLLVGCLVPAAGPTIAADLPAVFAKRTVRTGALVTAADVELQPLPEHRAAGVATSLDAVVGQEVRRNLYVNRPVMLEDIGAPTVVHRNSLVTLAYASGGLELTALGRAIDSAGLHEPIRVLNIDSRVTVLGRVTGPGMVRVGKLPGAAGAAP